MTTEGSIERAAFVFPNSVAAPDLISGAAFLYFRDNLMFAVPPAIMGNEDAWGLLDLVQAREPSWGEALLGVVDAQMRLFDGWEAMQQVLSPLQAAYSKIMTIYPTDLDALARVDDLVAASGLTLSQLYPALDPLEAQAEIVRHLLLEMWLHFDEDVEALYGYCESFFKADMLPMLTRAYLLRLLPAPQMHEAFHAILLNNPGVVPLLTGLDVEVEGAQSNEEERVAWEFFRQILRPYVDPLDVERAERVAEVRADRTEEVDRLRVKCERLVDELKTAAALEDLPRTVERFIRLHVADEIAALLQLNRTARDQFIDDLFTDEKAWAATLTGTVAWASGHVSVSVGAGIAAIATFGPKALRAARERRETLRTSDFALVYRLGRD